MCSLFNVVIIFCEYIMLFNYFNNVNNCNISRYYNVLILNLNALIQL